MTGSQGIEPGPRRARKGLLLLLEPLLPAEAAAAAGHACLLPAEAAAATVPLLFGLDARSDPAQLPGSDLLVKLFVAATLREHRPLHKYLELTAAAVKGWPMMMTKEQKS